MTRKFDRPLLGFICLVLALAGCSDAAEVSGGNASSPNAESNLQTNAQTNGQTNGQVQNNGVDRDAGGAPNAVSPPDTSDSKSAFCTAISEGINVVDGTVINVEPASDGTVRVEGEEMTLRQAVNRAEAGDTVLLADGTYTFPPNDDGSAFTGVYITTPGVTVRSASGNADAVVVDSAYRDHGNGSAPFTIAAAGVTIADLTVQRSIYHLVHLWTDGDQATLHNLRLIDGGQQFIKSSGGDGTIDEASITCSQLVMTDAGRDNVWGYGAQDGNTTCYTGGIDSHEGQGWTITDNYFEGIYCDASGVQRPAHGRNPGARGDQTYQGGLAEHAIHMWDSPEGGGGHLIARNHIVDCARGIGLGFRTEVFDVIVRDNMIYSSFAGSREHDVGISAERAQNTDILHNTVFFSHPDAYPNPIEYRWESTSDLRVVNNLVNGNIRARDGAEATVDGNVTNAEPSWFADVESADLRLADCGLEGVVDAGVETGGMMPDFDHDDRDSPGDVGADECQ